jgi:hypothetical protein
LSGLSVVPDHIRPLGPGGLDEAGDVSGQGFQPVVPDPTELVAKVIAPLIRGPNPKTRLCQDGYLGSPAEHRFRTSELTPSGTG